jgi:hypothetical protein
MQCQRWRKRYDVSKIITGSGRNRIHDPQHGKPAPYPYPTMSSMVFLNPRKLRVPLPIIIFTIILSLGVMESAPQVPHYTHLPGGQRYGWMTTSRASALIHTNQPTFVLEVNTAAIFKTNQWMDNSRIIHPIIFFHFRESYKMEVLIAVILISG